MLNKISYGFFIGFVLAVIVGCGSDDRVYFNGEILDVEEPSQKELLSGEAIELELPKYVHFSVYDTLCFLFSWDNPGGFYNLHNLKNGKHLGYFCKRGEGPDESAGVSPVQQFYIKDGHLKTDLLTVNRTLTPWDITGSLESEQTELDTAYRFSWADVCVHPYRACFRLSGDSMLVMTQPDLPFRKLTATLPRILIRTLEDNQVVREYPLFRQTIEGKGNSDFYPDSFFLFSAALKPDGKKAVLAMAFFPQIHMIDLSSGEMKGVRLKGLPSFSPDRAENYYISVQCDDRYIYALYAGESDRPTTVHVFDWDGRLLRRLELSHPASLLSLDPVSGKLYAMYRDEEEIYRYSLD